jgi:hypothetical protein
VKDILGELPWWVKWVAIPLIALFVFGGLVFWVISFLIGIVVKLVIFAALVGGLIFLVRRFSGSSGSRSHDRW